MPDASVAVLGAHQVGAFWLIALVGGHAVAALMHHYLAGDDTLKTMAPWVKVRGATRKVPLPPDAETARYRVVTTITL